MDHYQKKEQNYTKWNEQIWLSVQKEISVFQMKVTECMLQIGEFKKMDIEDYKVEPCLDDDVILGEEFYLENIRPECVKKNYLPKKVPTPEDLSSDESDSDSEEENEKPQVKAQQKQKGKKEKKGGKKGGKNSKTKNNQEQMKMKIVQQNFRKDIELVLNSHSLERMQIQFGLKHKKLEVKLITFFYVAYYIRKNKEIKKIQETQIFELINILIKIVRIFDGFQGKSFIASEKNKNQMVQVSPTLILDLKMCIKGLKEYYRYSNRKIIINYPKLVYYTNYDAYFPTLDIKPYPSQIQFIQAVKKAFNEKATITNPTLILYRTMIGSGKTSASLALSNLIVDSKIVDQKNEKLQLIYSCLIGSVRVQVGRYAYNKGQKFALAAMERSIKNQNFYYPRIINSFSCRNVKTVDLIISDLDCTYEMLNYHNDTPREKDIFEYERKQRKKVVNIGRIERQNIILFIDEPTAFCKSEESPATRKLFDILANYPPKLIILASATMPDVSMLPNTIKLIEQKNPGLQVHQIQSKQFQIGCQFCSFKGEVIFPHTNIKNKAELENIIKLLSKNPFLLRLYTGPSLFFLLKKCQEAGIKGLPKIDQLPEVRQADIIKATFRILKALSKQNDEVIAQVCSLAADETNLDYKIQDDKSDSDDDFNFLPKKKEEEVQEQQEIKQEKKDFVDFKRILKSDAHKFLGGCLIGTTDPLKFAKTVFEKWVKRIKPIKRLMEKYRKHAEQLEKQIKLIIDDKEKREEKKTQQISKLQSQKQALIEFPEKKRINTIDHYKKYCKNKQSIHLSMLIKPVPLQSVGEQLLEEVDDFVLKLLFCGVALYMEKGLSPKYLDKVEELASQNYLAFIITDQSLCYGTNFPISNVILCDDLATKLNMNEMFQLIGRAGRVGQSWTARAFLEPQGLAMLNDYIHNQEKAVTLEASVFEAIAKQHLDNPDLALRSTISEIRYVDIENPDKRIEVEIKKKKQEDSHIFKNVVLIPFTQDGQIICKKMPYKSLNYYEFFKSQIFYEDIPTKLNSFEQEIIDIEAYYKKQPQFIRQLLNRTVKRILLQNKIDPSKVTQLNQFKAKVYEQYYNPFTNTFTVLLKCPDDIKVELQNGFQLQEMQLKNEVTMHLDEITIEKLKNLCDLSRQLQPKIIQNPTGVLANDVAQIKKLHEELLSKNKMKFYEEMFECHEPQIRARYTELIDKVSEKEALQYKNESIIALFAVERGDFINVTHHRFAIDYHCREIWGIMQREIEKK